MKAQKDRRGEGTSSGVSLTRTIVEKLGTFKEGHGPGYDTVHGLSQLHQLCEPYRFSSVNEEQPGNISDRQDSAQ